VLVGGDGRDLIFGGEGEDLIFGDEMPSEWLAQLNLANSWFRPAV
jgi:hypothetical protein